MTNSINGLGSFPAIPPEPARGASASSATQTDSTFHQRLLDSLAGIPGKPHAAQASSDLAQVELLTSDKQAELSLQIMLQMRQQLLEAYQEIKDIRT